MGSSSSHHQDIYDGVTIPYDDYDFKRDLGQAREYLTLLQNLHTDPWGREKKLYYERSMRAGVSMIEPTYRTRPEFEQLVKEMSALGYELPKRVEHPPGR